MGRRRDLSWKRQMGRTARGLIATAEIGMAVHQRHIQCSKSVVFEHSLRLAQSLEKPMFMNLEPDENLG